MDPEVIISFGKHNRLNRRPRDAVAPLTAARVYLTLPGRTVAKPEEEMLRWRIQIPCNGENDGCIDRMSLMRGVEH